MGFLLAILAACATAPRPAPPPGGPTAVVAARAVERALAALPGAGAPREVSWVAAAALPPQRPVLDPLLVDGLGLDPAAWRTPRAPGVRRADRKVALHPRVPLDDRRVRHEIALAMQAPCGPVDASVDARLAGELLARGAAWVRVLELELARAERTLAVPGLDPGRIAGALPAPLPGEAAATRTAVALFQRGGWRLLGAACAQAPPSGLALLEPAAAGPLPAPPAPPRLDAWRAEGWTPRLSTRAGPIVLQAFLEGLGAPDAARLARSWRGDGISVASRAGAFAFAWAVRLPARERRDLARALHGARLSDGRIVRVQGGPGGTLLLLAGGPDAPVVVAPGRPLRPWSAAAALAATPPPSPVADAARLRAVSLPVRWEDGVARAGSLTLPLDGWKERPLGPAGASLSLGAPDRRAALEVVHLPTALAGSPEAAASRLAEAGARLDRLPAPVTRPAGRCVLAETGGRDRAGRRHAIAVLGAPLPGGETLLVRLDRLGRRGAGLEAFEALRHRLCDPRQQALLHRDDP